MRAILVLTQKCNLSCEYCTSRVYSPDQMEPKTALRAIDWAFEQAKPGEEVSFGFYGGEPLLCWDMLCCSIDHIRSHNKGASKEASISLTTNGTLLDDERIRYLSEHKAQICISIDGPEELHDRLRHYGNGDGSWAQARSAIKRASKAGIAVHANAVFGPRQVISLQAVVEHLASSGASFIHLNPDIKAIWTKPSLEATIPSFEQVALTYAAMISARSPVKIVSLDSKICLILQGGYQHNERCMMAQTEFAVCPGGDIYPCERFVGAEMPQDIVVGNIWTGIDRVKQIALRRRMNPQPPECSDCSFGPYCARSCGCMNYQTERSIETASTLLCAFEAATITAANRAISLLCADEFFVERFFKYIAFDQEEKAYGKS